MFPICFSHHDLHEDDCPSFQYSPYFLLKPIKWLNLRQAIRQHQYTNEAAVWLIVVKY